MSVSADLPVGSELLGYRVEAVLGRGRMGVVYRTEDLRLKRRVALKVLSPELAEDERLQERLLTESEQVVGLPSDLTHGLGSPYALRDTRRRARGKALTQRCGRTGA